MARFSNERIKEADTALRLLTGSIVPVSKQEVHSKMEAVNGEGYEMVSALLFHYGLVREQDGYYHLTDQWRDLIGWSIAILSIVVSCIR